eukprot:6468324-Amphidinium_carterae.2
MDSWLDGSKGANVAALLGPGHLIEETVSSGGGRVLEHLMMQIVAIHPADTTGVSLEVMPCGVSNMRLQTWTSAVFTSTDFLVIHMLRKASLQVQCWVPGRLACAALAVEEPLECEGAVVCKAYGTGESRSGFCAVQCQASRKRIFPDNTREERRVRLSREL